LQESEQDFFVSKQENKNEVTPRRNNNLIIH